MGAISTAGPDGAALAAGDAAGAPARALGAAAGAGAGAVLGAVLGAGLAAGSAARGACCGGSAARGCAAGGSAAGRLSPSSLSVLPRLAAGLAPGEELGLTPVRRYKGRQAPQEVSGRRGAAGEVGCRARAVPPPPPGGSASNRQAAAAAQP